MVMQYLSAFCVSLSALACAWSRMPRALPGEFRHVLLPGKELRLLVGFAYGVGGTRLRGCDDRVGLRLRAFQTAFRFAHQRGGAFQLHWQHLLEFVELAGERFAVHAHELGANRIGLASSNSSSMLSMMS